MSFLIEFKAKDVAAAKVVQQVQDAIVRAFLRRRKASNLKQADIAKKLDVDRAQVSRWLKGPSDMSLKSIGYLAWAMDVKLKIEFELGSVVRGPGCNIDPQHMVDNGSHVGNVRLYNGPRVAATELPSTSDPVMKTTSHLFASNIQLAEPAKIPFSHIAPQTGMAIQQTS